MERREKEKRFACNFQTYLLKVIVRVANPFRCHIQLETLFKSHIHSNDNRLKFRNWPAPNRKFGSSWLEDFRQINEQCCVDF